MTNRHTEIMELQDPAAVAAPSSAAEYFTATGVEKSYGPTQVLKHLDLTIEEGHFLTLLGPSGSGKTTLLMIIAGFVDADAGQLGLDGRRLDGIAPERRDLGVVFQNYALFPHMTVFQNTAYPLEARKLPKREAREKVLQALRLVHLEDFADRYPAQLSGGQQQRVALARALVFEPPMLLMDEPMGALDKALRTGLQLEIKRLQQRLGITVVYVTHDQEEALTMSDRIAVMRDGAIEQYGTPREIYERPVSRFVAEFVGDTNVLRGEVVAAEGDGCRIRVGSQEIRCVASDRPIGAHVELAIRPEWLSIAVEPSPLSIRGAIDEVVYAGESVKYWVRPHAIPDCRLLVKEAPQVGAALRAPGEVVEVAYEPHNVWALPGHAA